MEFRISGKTDYFIKLAIHLRKKIASNHEKNFKKYTKDLSMKKNYKEVDNGIYIEYLLYTRHYSK